MATAPQIWIDCLPTQIDAEDLQTSIKPKLDYRGRLAETQLSIADDDTAVDGLTAPLELVADPTRPVDIGKVVAGSGQYDRGPIASYRLGAKLAVGAMGIVHEAVHRRLGKKVAVKFLKPKLVEDRESVRRFNEEALASTRVEHPGVVKVFDVGEDATGTPYLIMEHLRGKDLGDRLVEAGGKLPADEAAEIVRQLADILAAAHIAGVIHRDLKPDNIFLVDSPTGKPTVKLLDFGVAKRIDRAPITRHGFLVGTPLYTSPEQAVGLGADFHSDVYSLGCVLYHLITGRPPFTGTITDVLHGHRSLAAIPPAKLANLPAELADLIGSMMSKSPNDRPTSMIAVRDRLADMPLCAKATSKGIAAGKGTKLDPFAATAPHTAIDDAAGPAGPTCPLPWSIETHPMAVAANRERRRLADQADRGDYAAAERSYKLVVLSVAVGLVGLLSAAAYSVL